LLRVHFMCQIQIYSEFHNWWLHSIYHDNMILLMFFVDCALCSKCNKETWIWFLWHNWNVKSVLYLMMFFLFIYCEWFCEWNYLIQSCFLFVVLSAHSFINFQDDDAFSVAFQYSHCVILCLVRQILEWDMHFCCF